MPVRNVAVEPANERCRLSVSVRARLTAGSDFFAGSGGGGGRGGGAGIDGPLARHISGILFRERVEKMKGQADALGQGVIGRVKEAFDAPCVFANHHIPLLLGHPLHVGDLVHALCKASVPLHEVVLTIVLARLVIVVELICALNMSIHLNT